MPHEHIANSLIADLKQLHDDLVEKLRKEMGHRIGYQEATKRKVRALARQALWGNEVAFAQLNQLVDEQPDAMSRADTLREVQYVMQEYEREMQKQQADELALGEGG